eukprot:6175042-Pleurochrysis_carterae.AAC.1
MPISSQPADRAPRERAASPSSTLKCVAHRLRAVVRAAGDGGLLVAGDGGLLLGGDSGEYARAVFARVRCDHLLEQAQQRAPAAPALGQRAHHRVVHVQPVEVHRAPRPGRQPQPHLGLHLGRARALGSLGDQLVVLGEHEQNGHAEPAHAAQEVARRGRHLPPDVMQVEQCAQ